MKIKNGFVDRTVAGSCIIVATGEASRGFNGVIKLNESGVLLWNRLKDGAEKEELIALLLEKYDVDLNTAQTDTERFIKELFDAGAIEE